MSRPSEITFTDDQEVSAALFQRAFDWVYAQLRAAQAQQPDVSRALADLQANGLTRLAATLGPVFERTVALDEHLQVLEAQYLGEGVVPAILAQAAASVDGKLLALGNEQDAQLAAYAGLAAAMFAAKAHAHTIADVAGLADALASRRPAVLDRFTTSGTWQKRDGLIAALAIVIGGGGGGGGGGSPAPNGNGVYTGGRGGTGAGFSMVWLAAPQLPATVSITIGAGGLGGAPSNNGPAGAGTKGGTTSFGNLLSAGGGNGGGGGSDGSLASGNADGGFGTETGGSISLESIGGNLSAPNVQGRGAGAGGGGMHRSNTSYAAGTGGIAMVAASGAQRGSGSSLDGPGIDVPGAQYGGGGGSGGNNAPGSRGGIYGGGGGGGSGRDAVPGFAGGDGAPGIAIILNLF